MTFDVSSICVAFKSTIPSSKHTQIRMLLVARCGCRGRRRGGGCGRSWSRIANVQTCLPSIALAGFNCSPIAMEWHGAVLSLDSYAPFSGCPHLIASGTQSANGIRIAMRWSRSRHSFRSLRPGRDPLDDANGQDAIPGHGRRGNVPASTHAFTPRTIERRSATNFGPT